MNYFPTTIKKQKEITTMRAIRALILNEQSRITTTYSPKNKELNKLYHWVEKNIEDKRMHD